MHIIVNSHNTILDYWGRAISQSCRFYSLLFLSVGFDSTINIFVIVVDSFFELEFAKRSVRVESKVRFEHFGSLFRQLVIFVLQKLIQHLKGNHAMTLPLCDLISALVR